MKKVGLIYHSDFLLHTKIGHPEHKGRLEYIMNFLEAKEIFLKVEKTDPVAANIADIYLAHDEAYVNNLQKIIESGERQIDADTYLTAESFNVALLSAGAAIKAMRETIEKNKVMFSLGRPPGHHAEPELGMGFCLFNNIAIAAKVAIKEYGIKKIVIIDFDVHHGNGTQKVFYEDDKVLFISVHQSPAYPGTGMLDEKGEGKGMGYNLNVPLPADSGDSEYEDVFQKIIKPAVADYQPELILVSAGFDAYYQDPLANMNLSEKGYQMMGKYIKKMADEHCDGKVAFCLEGGYHLEGQARSFFELLNVFLNEKPGVKDE